jgi:ABC-type uncharacterized transport system permease subunit
MPDGLMSLWQQHTVLWWALAVLACVCYAVLCVPVSVTARSSETVLGRASFSDRVWLWRGAWLIYGWLLLGDMLGLPHWQSGTRFGFALSLALTVWGVLGVMKVPQRVCVPEEDRPLALAGLFALFLLACFPGQYHPGAHSPWAPLHWTLGMASYGLFAVAVVQALRWNRAHQKLHARVPMGHTQLPMHLNPAATNGVVGNGVPLLRIERLIFSFVAYGFTVLSIAIGVGVGISTQWIWSHKTVFSLLAWLVFAVLLWGRHYRGWRGKLAIRSLYGGAIFLLMAYAGSRFVWEVVLQKSPALMGR